MPSRIGESSGAILPLRRRRADPMPQPQIFISYRRDDAAGYARALNDELTRSFGADRVFIDVDDINAGQPFSEVIQRSVGDSAVLLALIGKRWRGERDGAPPRLFDAGDFVRQEVAAALAKGLRVIPVLLDGTPMPEPAQLPAELQPLAGRNALELDNARFAADLAHLVSQVRGALGEAPPPARRTFAKWGARGRAGRCGGSDRALAIAPPAPQSAPAHERTGGARAGQWPMAGRGRLRLAQRALRRALRLLRRERRAARQRLVPRRRRAASSRDASPATASAS